MNISPHNCACYAQSLLTSQFNSSSIFTILYPLHFIFLHPNIPPTLPFTSPRPPAPITNPFPSTSHLHITAHLHFIETCLETCRQSLHRLLQLCQAMFRSLEAPGGSSHAYKTMACFGVMVPEVAVVNLHRFIHYIHFGQNLDSKEIQYEEGKEALLEECQ